MQEINIVSLLSKYSGEVVILACAACAISLILKKFLKFSNRTFAIISFFVGIAGYLAFGIFVKKVDYAKAFANCLTCGVVSSALSIFVKRCALMDNSEIKKQLEELLSSIILSEQLDEVIDGILEKIQGSEEVSKDGLKDLIKQNLNSALSDDELESLVQFIISACDETKSEN